MDCTFTSLPYKDTGYFSKIIIDYLSAAAELRPFYQHQVSEQGILDAIAARKKYNTDRATLVAHLTAQYEGIETTPEVINNIHLLGKGNVFTICTAHQPSIFTGHLYFIYKIIHAIKLCDELNSQNTGNRFVPVFWMGTEDADLDELGNIYLDGEKIEWNTNQVGAVGRMSTAGLDKIIHRIEGEYGMHPFGNELVALLHACYNGTNDIQTATFRLLNTLFGSYGLIVIVPDTQSLKKAMIPVFEDDLFRHIPSSVVGETIGKLNEQYKVQANPREVNLFYLDQDLRERIERNGEEWRVTGTNIRFTAEELKKALYEHPENFSPNVILRGLMQETILPNIAFIGGGGETAYWLELKDLFHHYGVPFPMLIVRQSMLIVQEKWKQKIDKLEITVPSLFKPVHELMNEMVMRRSRKKLDLSDEISKAKEQYLHLHDIAAQVDPSLIQHVAALQNRAIQPIIELEKKLIRAEKNKFDAEERQVEQIKTALFPGGSLQERIDSFIPYYALWGPGLIQCLYEATKPMEGEFCIIFE